MIKIASINTNGAIGNSCYLETIIKNNDITFVQEHWLNVNNKSFFKNICSNSEQIFFFSPMQSFPTKGRPWGGLCWIINKNIECVNFEVIDDGICVIDVKINNYALSLIGVYLAYNSSKLDMQLRYENQLKLIEQTIEQKRDESKEFILLGDFNGDIQRGKYYNDLCLRNFISKVSIKPVNLGPNSLKYTYVKGEVKSFLDYVMVCCRNKNVEVVHVDKNMLNTSDHLAIIASYKVMGYVSTSGKSQTTETIRNINWRNERVTEEYNRLVNGKINQVKFNNAWRDGTNIQEAIDRYYFELTNAIKDSNDETLIKYENKNKYGKSWWNDELRALKYDLKKARDEFKNKQSIEARENYKELKRDFRKTQRRCQFVYDEKKCKKIDKLFEKSTKDEFWKSFQAYKRVNSNGNIDEENVEVLMESVTKLFKLENSVIDSDPLKSQIKTDVQTYEDIMRVAMDKKDKPYVNLKTIQDIIKELKTSNTKGWDGLSNNMIKNIEGNSIAHKIKTLINAIICGGKIPKELNRSIIIPIIKDKNEKIFNSNNYRPISVSNVLAQILEKVILRNCPIFKNLSPMQFGFKQALSTHQPLFLLKELMEKHKAENMPLYIASLDAEKAYDSVWRDGIFFRLMEVIDSQIWLVLKNYYDNADGVFKINNMLRSERMIKITRGVKQGGVLSPQLFNFYIDELLKNREEMGEGCSLDEIILTIMAYCDDMLLVSPSMSHMNKLIDKCVEFGKRWLIKFNPKKSVILNGGEKLYQNEQIKIVMGDSIMPVVEKSKYLGILIDTIYSDDTQTLEKFKKVQSSFYSLGKFGIKPPGVKPRVKAFLYNTYCLPMGTYALGLMKLKKKTLQQLNIMQNNMIRFTLGIPFKTHIKTLLKCLNVMDMETVYMINKCTSIKLLHRNETSKAILLSNKDNANWWFYKELNEICELVNVSRSFICEYPDRVRELLIDRYFEMNEEELELAHKIEVLLEEFTFKNKKKLVDLIKLEF